ncbi:HAD-like domain-containing protein [Mortierella sp. GBAus27b]|nr:HAD-like domain-containing protein [Mortierella sp. GBAus27b]
MISESTAATDTALVPETTVKSPQVDTGLPLVASGVTVAGDAQAVPQQDLSSPQSETSTPATSSSASPTSSTTVDTVPEQLSSLPEHDMNENRKRVISLTAQWNGKKLPFEVDLDNTVGELKNKLMELTNVEPKRQKLMLVRGKLPEDHVVLSTLQLKDNQTFLMMGTPEAKVIKKPEVMPEVLNDLEEDYTPDDDSFASMVQNQKSLRQAIDNCNINIMNPLRSGKRLLVLDLDYTLIDCKALNSPLVEVLRPGLHHFLTVCYEHYDIVIWSQTSWRALEAKVTTLGLLTHPDYKISFVMDISTMFFVMSQRDGKPFRHQVKALDIIWNKFPQFSARNTIHIDDLSRNFAMNPRSGLKIGAYKNGAISRHSDQELFHLARYLVEITRSPNFTLLDHKSWKSHRRS